MAVTKAGQTLLHLYLLIDYCARTASPDDTQASLLTVAPLKRTIEQEETLESVLTCVAVAKRQQAPVHLHLVVHRHPSTDSPIVDVASEVAGRAARGAKHRGRRVLAVEEGISGRKTCKMGFGVLMTRGAGCGGRAFEKAFDRSRDLRNFEKGCLSRKRREQTGMGTGKEELESKEREARAHKAVKLRGSEKESAAPKRSQRSTGVGLEPAHGHDSPEFWHAVQRILDDQATKKGKALV